MMSRQTVAIIVAAGRSERFGGGDKVLLPLSGKPVLTHVMDAIERAQTVDSTIIVAGTHLQADIEGLLASRSWSKPYQVVGGGRRRQDSVVAGLAAAPPGAATAVILDGARPLTSSELIDRCVAAAGGGSAIAAIPVSDTLKRVDDTGMIEVTVARDRLWAAQTPQVFPITCLRDAFRHAEADDVTYTDEASLFESRGWPVKVVRSDPTNLKITWPEDIERAELYLAGSLPKASANE